MKTSVSLQGRVRAKEVKKPVEFMLQRVEKESWQQDESGEKSGGKKYNRKESTAEEEKGEFYCCCK